MKLKTIRELKTICQYTPHFVGGLVLITLAHEMIAPSPLLTAFKLLVFGFGGIALMFTGIGGAFLDDQSGEQVAYFTTGYVMLITTLHYRASF